MSEPTTLEELFSSVQKAQKKLTKASAALKIAAQTQTPQSTWTREENWKFQRYVTLLHKETQSCLGNFAEFIHVKHPDARKLVLDDCKTLNPQVEFVDAGPPRGLVHAGTSHEHKQEARDLWLCYMPDRLQAATRVDLHYAYGKLVSVRLCKNTDFWSQEPNTRRCLALPAGTNILPLLRADYS